MHYQPFLFPQPHKSSSSPYNCRDSLLPQGFCTCSCHLQCPWLLPLLTVNAASPDLRISPGKFSSTPSLGQNPLLYVPLEPGSYPQWPSSLIIIVLRRVWLFSLGLSPSPPAVERGDNGEQEPCLRCSSMPSQCLALSKHVWNDV